MHFYLYVVMARSTLNDLLEEEKARPVNLLPLLEIVHVEEGWWPEEARSEEIQAFYTAATNLTRHNIKLAA